MDIEIERARRPASRRDMGTGDHACRIYRDESEFLDALAAYIGGGLWTGEGALVIATDARISQAEDRLRQTGLDLGHFRARDRYLALSAALTMAKFVDRGWPDEDRFLEVMTPLVARARGEGRVVRACGEMASLLWSRGDYAGAVRLEQLWNKLMEKEDVRVLCAYPQAHFAKGSLESRRAVQGAHSRFIQG